MTSSAKLYNKELGEYEELDVDQLLAQLTPEEISMLAKEVDPDVSIFILDLCNVVITTFFGPVDFVVIKHDSVLGSKSEGFQANIYMKDNNPDTSITSWQYNLKGHSSSLNVLHDSLVETLFY